MTIRMEETRQRKNIFIFTLFVLFYRHKNLVLMTDIMQGV
jgi:hypothetical protein